MNVLIFSILIIICFSFYFRLSFLFTECLTVLSKDLRNNCTIFLWKKRKDQNNSNELEWIQQETKCRIPKSLNNTLGSILIHNGKRKTKMNRKRKRKTKNKTKTKTTYTNTNKNIYTHTRKNTNTNKYYAKAFIFFKKNENKKILCISKTMKLYNEKQSKSKQVQNLKIVKNVDNTILGKSLEGKEDKLVDDIPDKFINAFKWALQYRIKNFNCKFMRIQKLAKKNNEPLKSWDNYAIGYNEQLLSMLLKGKKHFIEIIKKLKSQEFFNFDIYSIFRFLKIDIRFLFQPDCIDHAALFYLLFGNLDKVLDYYHQNYQRYTLPDTANFSNEKTEFSRPLGQNNGDTTNGVGNNECGNVQKKEDQNVEDEKRGHQKEGQEKKGEKKMEEEKKEKEKEKEEEEEEEKEEKEEKEKEAEKTIETDKLKYFFKNYDKIEAVFKNSFQSAEELKVFFEKDIPKNKKLTKKEINFNFDNEAVVKTTEIVKGGLNIEMIKSIILRSPRLALVDKKTFFKRVSHYKNELNYSYDELIKIFFELPQFYAFGNLKRKFNELLYLDESIDEKDLKKLIKIYPRIFTYNIYRTIRPKLLYLIRHMNKTFKDVLSFPHYLSYSFRLRIIPRHIAFMNLYYPNYVTFYKGLVKKYTYAEFNKNFNSVVYRPDIPPINLKMLLKSSDETFRKHFNIPYDDFVSATQLAKHIHNPFIMV